MQQGKGRAIGYWVTTSILALELVVGSLTRLAAPRSPVAAPRDLQTA